jgi:hypothetical protein
MSVAFQACVALLSAIELDLPSFGSSVIFRTSVMLYMAQLIAVRVSGPLIVIQ